MAEIDFEALEHQVKEDPYAGYDVRRSYVRRMLPPDWPEKFRFIKARLASKYEGIGTLEPSEVLALYIARFHPKEGPLRKTILGTAGKKATAPPKDFEGFPTFPSGRDGKVAGLEFLAERCGVQLEARQIRAFLLRFQDVPEDGFLVALAAAYRETGRLPFLEDVRKQLTLAEHRECGAQGQSTST